MLAVAYEYWQCILEEIMMLEPIVQSFGGIYIRTAAACPRSNVCRLAL